MSFLNSLDGQQRPILNCCLALDRKACQQRGQSWHWRTGCQGRVWRQARTDLAPVLTPCATTGNSRERKHGTTMWHPSHQRWKSPEKQIIYLGSVYWNSYSEHLSTEKASSGVTELSHINNITCSSSQKKKTLKHYHLLLPHWWLCCIFTLDLSLSLKWFQLFGLYPV